MDQGLPRVGSRRRSVTGRHIDRRATHQTFAATTTPRWPTSPDTEPSPTTPARCAPRTPTPSSEGRRRIRRLRVLDGPGPLPMCRCRMLHPIRLFLDRSGDQRAGVRHRSGEVWSRPPAPCYRVGAQRRSERATPERKVATPTRKIPDHLLSGREWRARDTLPPCREPALRSAHDRPRLESFGRQVLLARQHALNAVLGSGAGSVVRWRVRGRRSKPWR